MSMLSVLKRVVVPRGLRTRTIRGGRLKGLRCRLDLRQSLQPWQGTYERCLQEWLVRNVRPGSVCVDVGASEGYFSLLMAKLSGIDGKIFAFEPQGISEILANFELNSIISLAKLEASSAFVAAIGGSNAVCIDDLVAKHSLRSVDIVKIDVDGGEVDVLNGMMSTLKRFHPKLFIEVHSEELLSQVKKLTDELGYAMKMERPEKHEHRPIEFNVFYFSV